MPMRGPRPGTAQVAGVPCRAGMFCAIVVGIYSRGSSAYRLAGALDERELASVSSAR